MIKIPTLCACGCNEVVWNGHKYRRGHNASNKGKSTWAKGKHFSEEHRKKIGLAHKGKHLSAEQKINMSKRLKLAGGTPGSFKKGHIISEEVKKKISLANKGRIFSEEEKTRHSEAYKTSLKWQLQLKKVHQKATGRIVSEETRQKLQNAQKNKPAPNKGKIMSAEQKKKIAFAQLGNKNHNWQGGKSFEPYCSKFNNQLKERIRDRDGRTCQLCSVKENGTKLSVHHIHYDKENCYPDLIALCLHCNIKANGNRIFYENLFMNKLNEKGLLFWLK